MVEGEGRITVKGEDNRDSKGTRPSRNSSSSSSRDIHLSKPIREKKEAEGGAPSEEGASKVALQGKGDDES